ncbi:MAG TPA: hypothetical protein VFR15_02690 [Chloroflexia bacterium]|nr:hypothetical protein [Chloroflexia bacterium]
MTTSRLRYFGLLIAGVFFALLLTLAPSGKTAQAQACDPSGSIDGTAVPNVVPPNTSVQFTATNFTPGEEVSFWFTLPDGNVFGTAAPLCCADQTGTVRFEPLVLPESFYQFPGKWALTVQGAASQHASVIYFCVVTSIQPTQPPATNTPVPVPPTNTPVPATNTPLPPTATLVPPTVEATFTPAITPTIGVSPTVALATPTVEATPTVAVATPTIEALPTTPPVVVPPVAATPVTPGMPTTGGSAGEAANTALYMIAAFLALSLIALGYFARRRATARR